MNYVLNFLYTTWIRNFVRSRDFGADPYPGRPKVLFIGLVESTHTQSWIGLLDGARLNVRLFALSTPNGIPPVDWNVRTYVSTGDQSTSSRAFTRRLYPNLKLTRLAVAGGDYYAPTFSRRNDEEWLRHIILTWRPDVIHTLGLDWAGELYFKTRRTFGLEGIGKWVLQLWGGSDLALSRLNPERAPLIAQVLKACDQLLSDNQENFKYAAEMGLPESRISTIGPVPGIGGVDVEALERSWSDRPSRRRLILWPKAYECPWSKALPVFEALKSCWPQIQPCEIHMLAMDRDTRMWFWDLPEEMRRYCYIYDRIPRRDVLELMAKARVMLAPTLVDGTPNTMLEAMASGAFPIVSPLAEIRDVVANERNVLFARNLYPDEIADALRRAATDDGLVDRAASHNLELVRRLFDRSTIIPRIIRCYEELAAP